MRIQAEKDIVETCRSMMNGEIHLLEGCRIIQSLRIATDYPENKIFFLIRSVESETDHFPLGRAREHYADSALKRADEQMNDYIEKNREDIIKSCRNILSFYGE